MKKIIVFLSMISIIGCIDNTKKDYGGPIVDKGKDEPTSNSDVKYWVAFRDTGCNKVIRVVVTVPTYYQKKIGDDVVFNLSAFELSYYGNGNEHLK